MPVARRWRGRLGGIAWGRRVRAAMAALLTLWGLSLPATAQISLWYIPSNGGQAGGSLPDFTQVFDPASAGAWGHAMRQTNVILLHLNTIRRIEEQQPGFIANSLAPFLRRTGMQFSVDSGLATFASCREPAMNQRGLSNDIDMMRRLSGAGIRLSYVALQSTLSRLRSAQPLECAQYDLPLRIRDVVWYMSATRAALTGSGQPAFGLIDASVAKGPAWIQANLGVSRVEQAYDQLFTAMQSSGVRLDFVQLDSAWENYREFVPQGTTSFADLRSFVAFLKGRRIEPGVLVTSNRSTSEPEFNNRVLQMTRGVLQTGFSGQLGLYGARVIPTSELPEHPAQQDHFPMTRVLGEIGDMIRH